MSLKANKAPESMAIVLLSLTSGQVRSSMHLKKPELKTIRSWFGYQIMALL